MPETERYSGKDKQIMSVAVEIVSAYIGKVTVPKTALIDLIQSVHSALLQIDGEAKNLLQKPVPAVPINKSITPDYLICLEDGKKLKMLKRHLRTAFGLTPEEYRAKWNLPGDYPMAAPNYTSSRSAFAKKVGFGIKRSRTIRASAL